MTAVSDSRDLKPQHSWGRSGTQVSASQTQLAASVTQFFCRVYEALHSTVTQLKIIGVEPMIYMRSWPIEAMMGVR